MRDVYVVLSMKSWMGEKVERWAKTFAFVASRRDAGVANHWGIKSACTCKLSVGMRGRGNGAV